MNNCGVLRVRAESLHHMPSQVVLRCTQVLAVADFATTIVVLQCTQLLAGAVVAATGGTIVGIFSRAVRRRRHEYGGTLCARARHHCTTCHRMWCSAARSGVAAAATTAATITGTLAQRRQHHLHGPAFDRAVARATRVTPYGGRRAWG